MCNIYFGKCDFLDTHFIGGILQGENTYIKEENNKKYYLLRGTTKLKGIQQQIFKLGWYDSNLQFKELTQQDQIEIDNCLPF